MEEGSDDDYMDDYSPDSSSSSEDEELAEGEERAKLDLDWMVQQCYVCCCQDADEAYLKRLLQACLRDCM